MTNSWFRPVLWLVLILSAVANAVASSAGALILSVIFGVVALGAAVTLAVHHYRNRNRAA